MDKKYEIRQIDLLSLTKVAFVVNAFVFVLSAIVVQVIVPAEVSSYTTFAIRKLSISLVSYPLFVVAVGWFYNTVAKKIGGLKVTLSE